MWSHGPSCEKEYERVSVVNHVGLRANWVHRHRGNQGASNLEALDASATVAVAPMCPRHCGGVVSAGRGHVLGSRGGAHVDFHVF